MAISFTPQEIELGRAMGLRSVNSQNDLNQIRAFARDNGVNSLDSQNDLRILLPKLQAPAPAEAPAQAPAPAQTPAQTPAKMSSDTQSTTDLLAALLMQAREDSAKAAEGQARWQEEARQKQADQEKRFAEYQAQSQASMAAMKSSYDMQLRAATATLPPPERSAVAPKLGDARTPTGRNAAANTLSQLRIISPSLLGNGLESITLGGI